jgi:hypothetical protein
LAYIERGLPYGWDYYFGSEVISGKETPFLELRLGHDDREPCGHREIGLFHYAMLGKMRHCQVRPNPSREDGLWTLSPEYDLIYRFKFRVIDRSPSACQGNVMQRKNLIKSIVMFDHLAPDGDIRKRRPNSISIWIDRYEGRMQPQERPGKKAEWFDDDVLWWNHCRAHGDWKNQTCMLTVWIGDSTMVRPIEESDYKSVEINLSALYRQYQAAFPPPFGQTHEEAVFRNIAAVGAVSESRLVFRIADVDLVRRTRGA